MIFTIIIIILLSKIVLSLFCKISKAIIYLLIKLYIHTDIIFLKDSIKNIGQKDHQFKYILSRHNILTILQTDDYSHHLFNPLTMDTYSNRTTTDLFFASINIGSINIAMDILDNHNLSFNHMDHMIKTNTFQTHKCIILLLIIHTISKILSIRFQLSLIQLVIY